MMNKESSTSQYTLCIDKETMAKLPAAKYSGSIHLVDNSAKLDEAISALRASEIIGFDTETRPSFKKGQSYKVALMQLSTRSDCYLIRLNKLGMPEALKQLLEDENALKIGLSIHDDFHNLHKICDFTPGGFIDLQDYVKPWKITDSSLTKIYSILFGHRISKGQRLTNWEADTLTPHQMQYASLDALACINIYDYLSSGKFDPEKSDYIHYPDPEEPKA